MTRIASRWISAVVALGAMIGIAGVAKAQDARANLAATSVIEEIKKRGTLLSGMATFVPWAMRNTKGELIGFEIDVATRLAQDMGVKVEFVPTAWDGIIPALLAGKFDFIIGGMTITPQRMLTVNFTNPYSATGVMLVASKKMAPNLSKLEDFNKADYTLTGRRGGSAIAAVQRLLPKATIRLFDDDAHAILEVVNGRAHAMSGTTPRPTFETLNNPDVLYIPIAEPFVKQADAMAVRKGDPDALAYLNNWITLRQQDGWLKERFDYWFGGRPWLDQVAK
ncbi:MAG: transporter substrate-binding domain-containing protein [Planctomycetes bacterium]|nr:transporter substrate-binding domain-containing protein [Planctomycetota bacterium]